MGTKDLFLKFRYNAKTFTIMFLLFPLIAPSQQALQKIFGSDLGGYILDAFRAWNFASIAIVILMFVLKGALKKTSIWAIAFCAILLLSSIINPGNSLIYALRVSGSLLVVFLLSDIYRHEKFIYYLQAMYYTLTIISVLTAITIFIYFPQGMWAKNRYLYGLDNVSFIYAFHGFATGFIYNLVAKKRLNLVFIFTYIIIALAYFCVWAATAIAIIALSTVLIVLHKNKIVRVVNYRIALIVCLATILFFMVIQNFDLISSVLSALGRDATLSGRTRIWQVGLIVLRDHYQIGIGLSDEMVQKYMTEAGLVWSITIGHLHNILLDIAVRGGVFAVFSGVMLFLVKYKNMMRNRKHIVTASVCVLFILSWLTCMFEFRITTYSFWFLIIITHHIDELVQMFNSGKERRLQ